MTASGLSIYGLSTDSPKANTTFKTKQNLPYTLLCDSGASLINAIGLKKAPKGTTRGVFVIDKDGKILAAEPGSPDATVKVVQKLVGEKGSAEKSGDTAEGEKVDKDQAASTHEKNEDEAKADVAADVADSAAMVDA